MRNILNAQIHFVTAVIAEKPEGSAVNPDKFDAFQLIQIFVNGIQKGSISANRKNQIRLFFIFCPAFFAQLRSQLGFELPGGFIRPMNDRKCLLHILSRFLRCFFFFRQ